MMMVVFSFAVMFVLMLVILLTDMDCKAKIIAIILAALMLIFIPTTNSISVERGKEIAMKSFCTQYTETELYNMSDAEKDLLPKTYGGATIKYWKINDKEGK